MAWAYWTSLAVIAVNFGLVGANSLNLLRIKRLQRSLDQDRAEVLSGIDQCRELDRLLKRICIAAFQRDHVPVWRAWAETMGSISVEISAVRKMPE